MIKIKIKKADQVVILSGKNKGKKGKILQILPRKNIALVEGVNMIKKCIKSNSIHSTSKSITKESPINLSKIAIIDPDSQQPTRIGFQIKEGKKYRISKRSGKIL